MDSLCLRLKPSFPALPSSSSSIEVRSSTTSINGARHVCAISRNTSNSVSSVEKNPQSPFSYPFRSLWPSRTPEISSSRKLVDGENKLNLIDPPVMIVDCLDCSEEEESEEEIRNEDAMQEINGYKKRGNWVLKILQLKTLWKDERDVQLGDNGEIREEEIGSDGGDCEGCSVEDEMSSCALESDVEAFLDREAFVKLLRRVPLSEVKLYGRMSYLGNLAYNIRKIKSGHLLKYLGLRYITSSLEKKAASTTSVTQEKSTSEEGLSGQVDSVPDSPKRRGISPATAYQIAASAASYLRSQTTNIFPFKSSRTNVENGNMEGKETRSGSEVQIENMTTSHVLESIATGIDECDRNVSSSGAASLMATTNSVTAVVAAKEETRQAVAKNLNSGHSSPCEWFICDDDHTNTRFFIIQGSESMASWQANLLFEPTEFEGTSILVHRGIYAAAKGIYQQILPEVQDYIKVHGDSATFRFTGHSLGGSLAMLVSLMLLVRGEVTISSLLPVITFGSPSIMCGGDSLLRKLGLPKNFVRAVTMHRDIVPRAFSCSYPSHVAQLLKAVNGNFRNHPCLKNQKLLYAPMGEMVILQPDESISPHHNLLPPGSGLYAVGERVVNPDATTINQLKAAALAFMNSPHPLEILSDPGAYGSEGTIFRDHDANSYLKSVRAVIRQEMRHLRREKREQGRLLWWPLIVAEGLIEGRGGNGFSRGKNVLRNDGAPKEMHGVMNVVIQGGRESLKRFGRLIASHHFHMLIVFMLPARVLILGTFASIWRTS